jgi:hypothetical protein
MELMRTIPKNKVIIVAFSGGESSAMMLKLILDKYSSTHKIVVCFCNTGEEDEETFIFCKKIAEYFNVEVVWLEYRPNNGFDIVDFDSAYRITKEEEENGYPNHPFIYYIQDRGLPQYPNRTCTREMKERTIHRYLSSINVMPKNRVECVGIRFDELGKRTPNPEKYYELILQGISKPMVNKFFENEMPFRLEIPSWLGNCGACISKSIRNLCTIARHRPEKFRFFKYVSDVYGNGEHTFYRKYNTVDSIFEKAKDESIKDAHDNRFDLEYQAQLNFDEELDSTGVCGDTCEAFMD